MRWGPKKKPKHDEIRVSVKFAFKPTEMDDGTVVWLERYFHHERYYSSGVWVTCERSAFRKEINL
jgi:hypothetical protein